MNSRDEQFQALFDRYYPRVFRFHRARVDHDDAHDLAQETFVRVFQNFDKYRGEAEWSFLQKVAHNLLVNWWRDRSAGKRKGKMVYIDDPDVGDEVVPALPTPDYAGQQQQATQRKRLGDAIRDLPRSQAEVLRLQLDGFKYGEIAALLHITDEAVKSRRRDALRFLKARLRDEPGGMQLPDVLQEDEE